MASPLLPQDPRRGSAHKPLRGLSSVVRAWGSDSEALPRAPVSVPPGPTGRCLHSETRKVQERLRVQLEPTGKNIEIPEPVPRKGSVTVSMSFPGSLRFSYRSPHPTLLLRDYGVPESRVNRRLAPEVTQTSGSTCFVHFEDRHALPRNRAGGKAVR